MASGRPLIRTPDQRLRVFVSSTLQELAEERVAARQAITRLRLTPVMFELGARPYPPRDLYRAYLEQSHIFLGIYWQSYGWVAPGETISGLEDEYGLSGSKPKLLYIKSPAPERERRLDQLLDRIRKDERASYKNFATPVELGELIENDLALLLTERFETVERTKDASEESSARRTSLPAWPTTFVGRQKELEAILNIIEQEGARLVTLTGPGGVGKSRLALHVAADLIGDFEDGVFFVPLTPIRDPALVIPAISQALGLRESSGRTLLEGLKDYLDDKLMLLLLDNFEQVIPAAPLVAEMLSDSPRLKVLVTSRAPLHIRGEREFPVPPLRMPGTKEVLSVEEITPYEAIELFVERAREVKPDFALTDENAQAIAEISQRLDGLPLAIELAAARIKILSPRALLDRLDSRLEVLTGGARDLPARQQTLRSTIGWSYDLMDDAEKVLFRRLGVFVGGCTLEAAEAVCNAGGDAGLDFLERVASLVDNSLLLREEEPEGEPRFVMLETIREYALERLAASGEVEAIQQRHAEFFLALAEQLEPKLRSGERQVGLRMYETEHGNLRTALAWSQAAGEIETFLRLSGAMAWFWYLGAHWSEGRGWLEAALVRADASKLPAVRAKVLFGVGMLAASQGEQTHALQTLQESTAQLRQLGDRRGLAYSLLMMGLVMRWQGNPAEARAILEESLALFREIGDQWGLALALGFFGDTLFDLGEDEEGQAQSEQSASLFRELGDKWGLAMALNYLGVMALRVGDDGAAGSLLEESVAIFREAGDKSFIGFPLLYLGDLARRQGDHERAAALYKEGLAFHREVGSKWGITVSLHNLGMIAKVQGDYRRAATLFAESLPLYQEANYMPGIAACLAGLAGVAAAEGQPECAARLFGAIQLLADRTDIILEPSDRTEVEHDLSAVRAQLSEDAFNTAWAQGQAMTMEQAIDEALAVAGWEHNA